MKHRLTLLAVIAGTVAMACGGATTPPAPAEEAAKTTLQMDMTPSSTASTVLTTAQPIADYLSKEIGVPITVRVPTSYSAVVEDLTSGNADIGWSGAVAYEAAKQRAGVEAVTASQRCLPPTVYPNEPQGKSPSPDTSSCKPQSPYPSIIVCGSGVSYTGSQGDPKALTQLKGKKMAFGDQISGSSNIWPQYYMRTNGVNPDTDLNGAPLHLSSQTAIANAVYNGTVDCGAMFGDARTGALKTAPDILTKTKVVFISPTLVPGDPQFMRSKLNSAQKAKIRAAFVKLGSDSSMKAGLLALYSINGLQPAKDSDYAVIKTFADVVKPGLLGAAIAPPPSPSASPTK